MPVLLKYPSQRQKIGVTLNLSSDEDAADLVP